MDHRETTTVTPPQRATLLGLGLLSCALSIAHGFATAPSLSGDAFSTGELVGAALGTGFLVILYAIVLIPLALGRAWAPTLGAVFAGITVAGALTDLAGLNGALTPPAMVLTLCLIGVNITWIRLEREDSGWVGLGTCLLTMLLFGVELIVLLVQGEPTPGELLPRLLIIAGAFTAAVAIRRHWKRSADHAQPPTSTRPPAVKR